MILKYLSDLWLAVGPAIGNHLWQSTLFAGVAGLLIVALRKNQARVRYWLWLATSVKFLIPFSLLVAIGSQLPWARGPAEAKAGLYFAMEEVSQPFTQPTIPTISRATPVHLKGLAGMTHLVPGILGAVWLCGFLLVLFVWCRRWRQLARGIKEAMPLQEGREVEALRRAEQRGGIRKPIPMFLSRTSLEPGVFGIGRPALLWPEGISDRLEGQHLDTILAHEVSHVRRRDNLAAAIHMVVEAIFWFYPLVWWLGTRLVVERERACDEEVLELGSEPRVYAESILKTCEFCVESPFTCMSGITGGGLKERTMRIMTGGTTNKLSLYKKLMLSAVSIGVVVGPVVFGIFNAPQTRAQSPPANGSPLPSFEVASIKLNHTGSGMISILESPGRFTARRATVRMIIEFAYNIRSDERLLEGPAHWISTEEYDIEAKEDRSVADSLNKLPHEQRLDQVRLMVQSLLADRFKLKVRRETKEVPVYALVVAKNGPKILPTKLPPRTSKEFRGISMKDRGLMTASGAPIAVLADMLSLDPDVGRLVLDQTGLKGEYDFTLRWTARNGWTPRTEAEGGDHTEIAAVDSSGPSIFTAIQEQLGLKLDPQKGPGAIFFIDYVEKPSEN